MYVIDIKWVTRFIVPQNDHLVVASRLAVVAVQAIGHLAVIVALAVVPDVAQGAVLAVALDTSWFNFLIKI